MDKIAKEINELHGRIVSAEKKTAEDKAKIGKLLKEQRNKLKAQFTKWVQDNIEFSSSTVYAYIRYADLSAQNYIDPRKSVSQNLSAMSQARTKSQKIRESVAESIEHEKKIPFVKAKEILSIADRIPEIRNVFKPSEKSEKKLRIHIFESLERAYDLGRKNKILTLNEKRTIFEKALEISSKFYLDEQIEDTKVIHGIIHNE